MLRKRAMRDSKRFEDGGSKVCIEYSHEIVLATVPVPMAGSNGVSSWAMQYLERETNERAFSKSVVISVSVRWLKSDVSEDSRPIEGLRVKGVRCLGDDMSAPLERTSDGMVRWEGTRYEKTEKK